MPRHVRSGSPVAVAAIATMVLAGCAAAGATAGSVPSSPEADGAEVATPTASFLAPLTPASPRTNPSARAATAIDGRFDIGGRSLYLRCEGSGSPTLILEPGDGGSMRDMQPIADAFSADHRVCRYDRANMGQSDAAPKPRPAHELATDLRALLDAAGVNGPYLPVGTSLGGMSAYVFSVLNPDDTVGFIAINPPPNPEDWLPAVKSKMSDAEYADEIAYGSGKEGDEQVDQRGWLDIASPPASMPYGIVDSSTAQCDDDQLCLKVYDVIEAQTRDMAKRGSGGTWVQIPGSHQLQLDHPERVIELIREIAGS
jgi:pimeloyl-ACP methyl ester carboxylesterase